MCSYKICFALLLVVAHLSGIPALAANIPVYKGEPANQLGLTLGPWGSGSAEENLDRSLAGGRAIRIVTEGWFSGGSIELSQPVKLYLGSAPKNEFLVFVISPAIESDLATSGIDYGWYNRASRRAAAAGAYDFGAESIRKAKIEHLKLTLISEGGQRSDAVLPVGPADEGGWIRMGVPLAKLAKSSSETDYTLKRILMFSDVADTINIGAIEVVEDNEPIRADLEGGSSYVIGDIAVFHANATAGLSSLRISWDFDDKDGIQEDAVGEIIRHVYMKPGDYTVTLTVADVDGIKSSVTDSIKVHVE